MPTGAESGQGVTDRRRARSERTEAAIVRAADELFVSQGYARTSMLEVAARAGVSDRTVYVRFATKADLLKRVIDVAAAGDTGEAPVSDRSWMQDSMTAPTLEARLEAFVAGVTAMQARLVPLVAVAVEVEASEPVIAAQARNARGGTLQVLQAFWSGLVRDGLVDPGLDVAWVAETTMLLSASETALLRTRTIGAEAYAEWLARVLRQFATPAPS
jgi:AcrR family transcriptional regulator